MLRGIRSSDFSSAVAFSISPVTRSLVCMLQCSNWGEHVNLLTHGFPRELYKPSRIPCLMLNTQLHWIHTESRSGRHYGDHPPIKSATKTFGTNHQWLIPITVACKRLLLVHTNMEGSRLLSCWYVLPENQLSRIIGSALYELLQPPSKYCRPNAFTINNV